MYCLSNVCYVCLEETSKLISNINNSSLNKDIIYIIGYLPSNLAWWKTKRNILVCEQCCLRLRETCQFLQVCLKTSARLQGYTDNLNTTPLSNTDNEAKLLVHLSINHKDIDEVKREIQLEDEQINTFHWQPNIEETEVSLVKEENICKKEVDDQQEYPTDNNSTEIIEEMEDVFGDLEGSFVKKDNALQTGNDMDNNCTEYVDNERDSKISPSDNVHITNPVHTSTTDVNTTDTIITTYNCSTCSKSFITKSGLYRHKRIHTGEHKCIECKKCFGSPSDFIQHMRVHTGVKLYKCATCEKRLGSRSALAYHLRTHIGARPYKCSECDVCFGSIRNMKRHQRVHNK